MSGGEGEGGFRYRAGRERVGSGVGQGGSGWVQKSGKEGAGGFVSGCQPPSWPTARGVSAHSPSPPPAPPPPPPPPPRPALPTRCGGIASPPLLAQAGTACTALTTAGRAPTSSSRPFCPSSTRLRPSNQSRSRRPSCEGRRKPVLDGEAQRRRRGLVGRGSQQLSPLRES